MVIPIGPVNTQMRNQSKLNPTYVCPLSVVVTAHPLTKNTTRNIAMEAI